LVRAHRVVVLEQEADGIDAAMATHTQRVAGEGFEGLTHAGVGRNPGENWHIGGRIRQILAQELVPNEHAALDGVRAIFGCERAHDGRVRQDTKTLGRIHARDLQRRAFDAAHAEERRYLLIDERLRSREQHLDAVLRLPKRGIDLRIERRQNAGAHRVVVSGLVLATLDRSQAIGAQPLLVEVIEPGVRARIR